MGLLGAGLRASLGGMDGPAAQGDGESDEGERPQRQLLPEQGDVKRMVLDGRFEEEMGGEVTQHRGQQRGAEVAVPGHGRHRDDEGCIRGVVVQEWREQQADEDGRPDRDDRESVAEQGGSCGGSHGDARGGTTLSGRQAGLSRASWRALAMAVLPYYSRCIRPDRSLLAAGIEGAEYHFLALLTPVNPRIITSPSPPSASACTSPADIPMRTFETACGSPRRWRGRGLG